MLDLENGTAMPVKDTPTRPPSKPDDSLAQKSTPKRPPGDMKDALVKGAPVGVGDINELLLEVTCGQNQAGLYLSRLQLGSKGTCVLFENSWLTPNEFQYISGRETAKDWKRSIKHHGKSLKVLISKGILTTSPLRCNCGQCSQSKEKVSKYIVTTTDDVRMTSASTLRDVKMTSASTLRDVLTTDPAKITKPDCARERFYRAPSESNETKRDSSHSLGGARYAPACDKDKGVYGTIQDIGLRSKDKQDNDKQDADAGYQSVSVSRWLGQGGHLANSEQTKSSVDSDVKLKAKKKLDGNENELSKEESRLFGQADDQRKTGNESNKSDVTESCVTSQKRSASSGTKPSSSSSSSPSSSGSAGTLSQSSGIYHLEPSYQYTESVGTKPSAHDRMRKSTCSLPQSTPSYTVEKPSCRLDHVTSSPSGKNFIPTNPGSAPDLTRLPTSESSFMFPSFGSPYYPMIPGPQLPAYYPNPYMWPPMPFPASPPSTGCSYGWTAPSEMTTPNRLRSPVRASPLEGGMVNADQAFNFPWMKRSSYPSMDRDSTNESGKRKLDSDPSDHHHTPSKHPLYLPDGLRSTYGDPIGWAGYSPNPAAALDFRFLPYNIPSYIPDIRPTHGLFGSNFFKGSENPTPSGFGLYPGFFPTPCLGINSR